MINVRKLKFFYDIVDVFVLDVLNLYFTQTLLRKAKLAPNAKSFLKVAEHNWDRPTRNPRVTRRPKIVSRATGRYAATSFDQLRVCPMSSFVGVA